MHSNQDLLREIEALRNLNQKGYCANIPQLLFAGIETWWKRHAFVYDSIGTPLSCFQVPLNLQLQEEIFFEVTQALNFIHQSGYVYVDLHPGNIIIQEPTTRETEKMQTRRRIFLIDFGSVEIWNGSNDLVKKEPFTFCCNPLFAAVPYLLGYRPTHFTDLESFFYLSCYIKRGPNCFERWKETSTLIELAYQKEEFLKASQNYAPITHSDFLFICQSAQISPLVDGFFSGKDLILTFSSKDEEINSIDENRLFEVAKNQSQKKKKGKASQ